MAHQMAVQQQQESQLPFVREYYRDKEIFLTGGTGYLGKVVIEKLLRSCPEVKRIFLLIRSKKGNNAASRLNSFLEDQVFDLLRQENPKCLDKLECVSGDVREIGLGISDADFQRLRNCSIVIHSAATVRFDERLTDSILMNTRGTRETLLLAKRLDKVEVFNHVSTTFCNPEHQHSEERLYPVHVQWRDAIKLAETLDEETFEALSKLYTDFHHPNTYTFSKRLSEHLVNDMRSECNFPIVILRPSVVTPTAEEPFPGWVDNFNGPTGLIIASVTGIYRFAFVDINSQIDYQPVDVVAKSILLSTWKHGSIPNNRQEDIPIYNSSSNGKYAVSSKFIFELAEKYRFERPLLQMFWYPNMTFTKCHAYFVLLTVLCLAIPTNILDFFLDLFHVKIQVRLSRVVRKIFYVQESLTYFMNIAFTFDNKKCLALDYDLHPEEFKEFRQDVPVPLEEYLTMCMKNSRVYLMKEPLSTIPRARRKMYILAVLHYSLQILFYGVVAYITLLYMSSSTFYKELFN